MPQVSKYPVSKDIYEQIFDIFLGTLARLQTKKQVSGFMVDFLTPTETVMLAKRLAIGVLLAKKYDYREISRILRVSTATVGSVSLLYNHRKNFRNTVDEMIRNEKMKMVWLDLGEKITNVLSKGGTKASGWFYLKEEIRKKKQRKAF